MAKLPEYLIFGDNNLIKHGSMRRTGKKVGD
jgi:hypothetical protein